MSFRCSVCGYVFEGDALPDSFVCPVCHQSEKFEQLSDTAPAAQEENTKEVSYGNTRCSNGNHRGGSGIR